MSRTSLSCATLTCGKRSSSASVLVRARKRSQGKFRDDERMDHNLPLLKTLTHLFVSRTEMVDPN